MNTNQERAMQAAALAVGIVSLWLVLRKGAGQAINIGSLPVPTLGGATDPGQVAGQGAFTINIPAQTFLPLPEFHLETPDYNNTYNIGSNYDFSTVGGDVVAAGNGDGGGCCANNGTNGWRIPAPTRGTQQQMADDAMTATQFVGDPYELYKAIESVAPLYGAALETRNRRIMTDYVDMLPY